MAFIDSEILLILFKSKMISYLFKIKRRERPQGEIQSAAETERKHWWERHLALKT